MVTLVSSVMVIAPVPVDSNPGVFKILDQDGKQLFDYTLESQMCEPGSKRELIKSTLPNDLAFGYLCQNSNSTTLGLYRFEVKDDAETKLKAIVLSQVWVTDIA